MDTPVLIRINRKRCILLGGLHGFFGLFMLAISLGVLLNVGSGWLVFLGVLCGALFLFFAVFFIGLARRNPVALRMDNKGISGFYCDPASWEEIKSIDTFTGQKHHRFLGFELHDPVAFRDRQTPWRRYVSHTNGKARNLHLVVPEIVLKDAKVDDMLVPARALKEASRGTDDLHPARQS
ncbi:MAG: hypothetical protein AB8B60_15680 [Sulfitobacter sp.]